MAVGVCDTVGGGSRGGGGGEGGGGEEDEGLRGQESEPVLFHTAAGCQGHCVCLLESQI